MKTLESLFLKKFVRPTYKAWRVEGGTGKDLVGKYYEEFRKAYYKERNFIVETKNKKKKVAGYSVDVLVRNQEGSPLVYEESKGHYVDACFLGRAVLSAAKVFDFHLTEGTPVPYFVLSCPTTMGNFKNVFDREVHIVRADLQDILREKFVYLPLCEHDRVGSKHYFKTPHSCFELDPQLISRQEVFLTNLDKRGVS